MAPRWRFTLSATAVGLAKSRATSLFSDIARLEPERSLTMAVDAFRVWRTSPRNTVVPESAGAPFIITEDCVLVMTMPSARDSTNGPEPKLLVLIRVARSVNAPIHFRPVMIILRFHFNQLI
jgi:hypothetical protein